jgi:hypothetical protein
LIKTAYLRWRRPSFRASGEDAPANRSARLAAHDGARRDALRLNTKILDCGPAQLLLSCKNKRGSARV